MQIAITVFVMVCILLLFFLIATRRKLWILQAETDDRMRQIIAQLSGIFDSVHPLLETVKTYDEPIAAELTDSFFQNRQPLSATAGAADVQAQETALNEIFEKIDAIAAAHTALQTDEQYCRLSAELTAQKQALQDSYRAYNQSIIRLNHIILTFPTAPIAKLLHFPAREFLKENL